MDENTKRTRPVHIVVIIIVGLLLAAGWLCASFLFAKVTPNETAKSLAEVFLEFWKTIFAAGIIAFVLDKYLKGVFGEGKAARITQAGITDVYPSRRDADQDLVRCVNEASQIDIIGISLRDFLLTTGQYRNVWEAIEDRLKREDKQNLPIDKRLRVRLLILDPRSSEGLFRHNVEKATIGISIGIPFDIPQGLEEVRRVCAEIHQRDGHELLKVNLYHHCPFSFLFLTNKQAFVEQYYYKNHTRHVDLPLLHYAKKELHDEFRTSFEMIWKSARPGILVESEVGTAHAIENGAIKNIFRQEHRSQSGRRQAETLARVGKDQTVRILTISGKHYITDPILRHLKEASDREARIHFLLLNPVSSQAVLRAIADTCAPSDITEQVRTWDWEKHRKARLYTDTYQTIRELGNWIRAGCRFTVRLHHSSPACALFLTPTNAFVEQYIYGRSIAFEKNRVLGGEYPILEFGQRIDDGQDTSTPELQMVTATFEVMWKSYSVQMERYLELDEEEEFQKTLAYLGRWTGLEAHKADTGRETAERVS
jgi:hypothetical protein